jgi:hypothetical protein
MIREVSGSHLTTKAIGHAVAALKVKRFKKSNHLQKVTRVPPMKKEMVTSELITL